MFTEQKATRKLRAILSADVKGYSLLIADDEIHTIETLKKYRQIMSNFVQQHSGRVVDNPGDNLLAEFSSSVDAVHCAVEIQKKLQKENARYVEDMKLQFRIGVNIGDVVHDGDRIYGSGVNVAARIEGIADPGGICISRNTYDHVKDKLELEFEYLGEHEVKNIKEPVRVYRVLMGSQTPKSLVMETLELPDKPSIAVLPFDNMSGDPGQEYFSDGLTEQIINGLCKVSNLFVIARNSSFAFKGKSVSIKQIAREMGVKYILEGSVQRAGNRLRITAQLIDAATDYHLWSESYDRDLEDIFALQDEITLIIIETMRIKLTVGEQARLWAGMTTNIQAFDMMMRGLDAWNRVNEKDNKQAQHFFEQSINLDKSYALAYAWLGFTHISDIFYGWSKSPIESFGQAEICAEKGLSLNDSLDTVHNLLAWNCMVKRQHDEAIKEAELAIDLNPNGADVYASLAFIHCFADNSKLAIELVNRALRLNPIPTHFYYTVLGIAYRLEERYGEAIELVNKCLEENPDNLQALLLLAACYSFLNRSEDANKASKEILRINPNFSVVNYVTTLPYKNQEVVSGYVDALRKAGLPE
ncbi:MAG: adenylate/guanylate cyclase domain-containing protein [Desulfobacteraceae bacterium]|jgi:adenylate cyclase|nr:adenylate/guanylate cyclase domain-containing protein [Desulfobacteraceae bacterium]MDH3880798.1 adenylate/guanylate cyclase domain-containing protein [Desulfobacteraceae bacterium]